MSIIKSVEKDIKELIKSAGYEIDRFILQPSIILKIVIEIE